MRVDVSNVIRVEDPTPEMWAWCRNHLVLPNPDYTKKARMGFWTGDTPKTISLYEKHGNALVLPFGVLRDLPEEIVSDAVFSNSFQKPVAVDLGDCEVPLYDYQRQAVEAVYEAQYGILQSPAGSGKTQMGIALIKKFGKRALWVTHTADLLRQSKYRAEQYTNATMLGTITEGQVNLGEGITFATVQTLSKLDLAQYRDYWDVVVVDECHRVAGSPTAVTQFSKVLNSLAARHKIGLSATVHRADGLIEATYALVGRVVHTVPEEAVGDKIMRVGIKPVGTGIEIGRECLNTDGTLNYAKLINYLCENNHRTRIIASFISANRDKSCLILSDRLGHLEQIMQELPPEMQSKAVMVSGKMTSKKGKAEREKAIEDMRTGKKRYLFATYSLCKEGLDIPRLERLFLTTPVKDFAVVTQSIGRIARVMEGKSTPIAYDFVDAVGYLIKAYKTRCRHYRKAGAYFWEEHTE